MFFHDTRPRTRAINGIKAPPVSLRLRATGPAVLSLAMRAADATSLLPYRAAACRPQRLLDFARRLAAGVLPVDFLRHSDAQYTRPARFLVAIMKAGSGSWQQHARVVLSELQPADGDSEALGTAWVRCYAEPAAATGDRKSMTHGALGTGPCYVNSCYLRVSFISAF